MLSEAPAIGKSQKLICDCPNGGKLRHVISCNPNDHLPDCWARRIISKSQSTKQIIDTNYRGGTYLTSNNSAASSEAI